MESTQRVLQQEELIEKRIFDSFHTVIWEADFRGSAFSYLSENVKEVFGFSHQEFMLKPQLLFDIIHEADQPEFHQAMHRILIDGNVDVTYRVVWPDKSEKWVRSQIAIVRDEQHIPRKLRGLSTPTSEPETTGKAYRLSALAQAISHQGTLATKAGYFAEQLRAAFNVDYLEIWQRQKSQLSQWQVFLQLGDRQKSIEISPDVSLELFAKAGGCAGDFDLHALAEPFRMVVGNQPPEPVYLDDCASYPELEDWLDQNHFSGCNIVPLLDMNGTAAGCIFVYRKTAFTHQERRELEDFMHGASSILQVILASQEIERSERRLRKAFEQADDALLISNNGKIILVNDTAVNMFRCENKEQLLGKNTLELSPEFQYDGTRSIDAIHKLDKRIADKGKLKTEWLFRRIDNTEFYADVRVMNIEGDASSMLYINIRDMHFRWMMEKRLRESEAKFRIFASQPFVGLIILQAGKLVYCNDTAMQMSGYQFEELMHQKNFSLIRNLVHHPIAKNTKSEAEGGVEKKNKRTLRIVTKDGSAKWIDFYFNEIHFEGKPAALLTMIDVTENRNIQRELRQKDAWLQLAVDCAEIALWEYDIIKDEVKLADNWYDITGYKRGEIPNKLSAWLELIHPDDLPFAKEEMKAAMTSGEMLNSMQRMWHKSGVWLWVMTRGKIVEYDDRNRPWKILGSHLEVSDRVQAIDKLREAKEYADQANRAKSEFLANMSHELRTPLHAILSFSRFGLKKLGTAPVEKIRSYFSQIHESGNRLMELLSGLLDLSKLEAGKMEFHFASGHIEEVINIVLSEFSAMVEERRIKIIWNRKETAELAVFDRMRISQVLRNLLSNALKFSFPKSQITIYSGMEKLAAMDEPVIHFSICDEGIGIPESEVNHIFDQFTQSSKTKTGAGGTGLGLAICKKIIDGHGGRIWAESNANGTGATLHFYFPQSNEAHERKQEKNT